MQERTIQDLDTVRVDGSILQTTRLLRLMYIQTIFLGITYVFGIWLATVVKTHISVSQPELLIHVIMASTFVSLTAATSFVAALQRERLIASLNLVLFLAMVLAGFSGFVLLGNPANATQLSLTGFLMIGSMGFAMPVTGYSIAKVKRIIRIENRHEVRDSSITAMALLTLIALPMVVIAGVATRTIALSSALSSFYGTSIAIHFAFAAVTGALVLGVLVFSVIDGLFSGSSQQLVTQRVAFSILGLAAVSLSGGSGIIAAGFTSVPPGISYIVLMAEVAVLVYASMILVIAVPFKHYAHSAKSHPSKTSAEMEVK